MKANPVKIEIMDTTLRDGEQTSGVSFVPHEKLMIARALLQDLNVDRIEVASARVSEGEVDAVRSICQWARQTGRLHRVEVLGFVDGHASLDWIHACGCKNINLLCKGSENHCTNQLKKTLEQHVADIRRSLDYAEELGIAVNVYLEDWSNGMKHSPDYVFALMDALKDTKIRRFMLPDTLGILNPLDLLGYIRKMVKRYPGVHFDFHAHNDYDLAISNVLAAVLGGCRGIHTSVNGLGERAGNAPLASVQAILKDQFNAQTWWKAIPASLFRPTVRLRARVCLRRWPVCMPTETTRPTFIATTFCPSVSAVSGSMPWAKTAGRPISSRTWKNWVWNCHPNRPVK